MTEPDSSATVVEGIDIDALHAVVTACPGVSSLGSGTVAALTTYLPGRRIPGIRINADSVELEVVAAWGTSTAAIVSQIRSAVAPLAVGRPVDITITDVELPQSTDPTQPAPPEREL